MKKTILTAVLALSFWSVTTSAQNKTKNNEVLVSIDLTVVKDDKIMVTVIPPAADTKEITYHIPKIIPGTYSEDNYGKLIDDFKAFDKKGTALDVVKADENSWTIKNAKTLAKITYWVNDTFDSETGGGFG